MAVTVHAVLLMSMPLLAAVVCLVRPRRSPLGRPAGKAAIIAGSISVLVLALSAHLCDAGNPNTQCLIIGVSMWLVLTFCGSKAIRIGTSVVMTVIMFGLSNHYIDLVHSRKWYGHPYSPAAVRVINKQRLSSIKKELKEGKFEDGVCPAGWLRDTPLASDLSDQLQDKPFRFEVGRAWHTIFTRLFPLRRVEQDFWFPGGRIPAAADSVVLKDHPQDWSH